MSVGGLEDKILLEQKCNFKILFQSDIKLTDNFTAFFMI